MYQQAFSRDTPGCIVVLLDRSDSMKRPWGDTGMSLADGAAAAINKILLELCVKSTKAQGGEMRRYFDVGVFGYGLAADGSEGVSSVLPAELADHGIVLLPTLADHPLAVREAPSLDAVAPGSRVPIWVEPAFGWRTPMCEAIAVAGGHIYDWVNAHPNSFPPIVINISDGFVTDSPYEDVDLEGWAKRLTTISTADGQCLLLNIFLSQDSGQGVWFPAAAHGVPEPGPQLFEISSPLPAPMVANARSQGVDVAPDARGLVFNADLSMLVRFLEIGTRVDVRHR